MANQESSVMQIEDIHGIERYMFWFERLAIIPLVLIFPYSKLVLMFPYSELPWSATLLKLPLFSAAVLLLLTNAVYLALSFERQFIRRFFFEPDIAFYIERPAILAIILPYVLPDGPTRLAIIPALIGLCVLILTNHAMIHSYLERTEVEPQSSMNSSLSSKTNTPNAKETSQNIDQEVEASYARDSITSDSDFECLPRLVTENGDKETAFPMNNSPIFQTNSPSVEPWKDGKILKKEEAMVEYESLKEISAMTRNFKQRTGLRKWFIDGLSEWDTMLSSHIDFKKEDAGHGQELKITEDRNNKSEAAEDVQDFEKIVDDHLKEEKVACNGGLKEIRKIEDNIQNEVKDEAGIANDFNGVNHSWEKVFRETFFDETEPCFNQKTTDEVIGNYKSDGDSSWEEVQNILDAKFCASIASLKGAEDQEATSNYDSDKRSWEEEQSNQSFASDSMSELMSDYEGKSISSSDSMPELVPDYEREKKSSDSMPELPVLVSLSSSKSMSNSMPELVSDYEGKSMSSSDEREEKSSDLMPELVATCERERKDLTQKLEVATKLCKLFSENGFEREWDAKLDVVTKNLEHYPVIEEERLNWNEEKEYLRTKLDAAVESLEEERVKWKDEKGELCEKLAVATQSLQYYKAIEKGFAEERQKWDEEKNALNAIIIHADENVQYCQTLVNAYAERYRLLELQVFEYHSQWQSFIDKWIVDTNDLHSKLNAAISSIESYKAWCTRSEQFYKTCFEEYEEKCRKLMQENLDLSTKLSTESSFTERYIRLLYELEEKCHRLEEEKSDLTGKLSVAKAASELYRACLHDLVS
ncbi:uncharacterized protein LOC110418083 [Herrania umbratica]|uniref:Uncharacterized protein LOC110418083 n=1 Tax=Herrania umbratica TaxID=108875 RepID=A0A6J1AGN4_9ROSI|nr:uncharacterized protein LOC110418083 [Herrania umbratica]